MRKEVLRMERVTYAEKGVTQLEDFNLQIYKGEIVGFIPVNGHGLSAFLKLLQFNLPLEDGFIYYGEKLINSWKEAQKNYNRISVIQSKSCLVERMTVADNIFVLRQGFRQHIIRPSLFRKQLEPFFKDIDMEISADSYVEKLTYFERVVVEILRGVIMGHQLIVLYEISTIISEVELKKLYRIMQKYARQGISFLYISPHFEEMLQICNRAVLLSYGRIQKVVPKADMKLYSQLVYSEKYNEMVRNYIKNQDEDHRERLPVLELKNITCDALRQLNLKIHAGECVVLQSMDQRVFCSLIGLLTGDLLPEKGRALLGGKKINLAGNRAVAVIQEEPTKTMIFHEMSYMDNLCFGLYRRLYQIWGEGRIRESIRMEYGPVLGEEVFTMQTEELSERQKYQLVYTRILLQRPSVVFCVQPFKGADLPHRMFVWEMLKMLLDKGIAVVILAVNLADSMSMAKRLFRIDSSGTAIEISKEEFAMMSSASPWQQLYVRKGEGKNEQKI